MFKNHLKVLPVPGGVRLHLAWVGTGDFLRKTAIAFNRDGWYLVDGRSSWIEISGTAVEYDGIADDFERELSIISAGELRPEQVAGLRAITDTNLATLGQRALFYNWELWYSCRETYRRSRQIMCQYKKKPTT